MRTITIDVPDELAVRLAEVADRLPDIVAQILQQPAVPTHLYREILTFLASTPTAPQVAAFSPAAEVQQRLQTLLERSRSGDLPPADQAELDELERIEHVMVMPKSGAVTARNSAS